MEWISIEERKPEDGQSVLVFGTSMNDLGDVIKNQIGLVIWGPSDCRYGHACGCVDTCYYDIWYEDVTHWMPIPKQPNK